MAAITTPYTLYTTTPGIDPFPFPIGLHDFFSEYFIYGGESRYDQVRKKLDLDMIRLVQVTDPEFNAPIWHGLRDAGQTLTLLLSAINDNPDYERDLHYGPVRLTYTEPFTRMVILNNTHLQNTMRKLKGKNFTDEPEVGFAPDSAYLSESITDDLDKVIVVLTEWQALGASQVAFVYAP